MRTQVPPALERRDHDHPPGPRPVPPGPVLALAPAAPGHVPARAGLVLCPVPGLEAAPVRVRLDPAPAPRRLDLADLGSVRPVPDLALAAAGLDLTEPRLRRERHPAVPFPQLVR